MPGPPKQFPVVLTVPFTEDQAAHIKHIAAMAGVSVNAAVRALVDDSLAKARGDYSPLPSVEEMVLHGFPLAQVAHLLPPAPQIEHEKE